MALLQRRDYRNETAFWFGIYARRGMFRRLGYQSDFRELRDDEAEWMTAVDMAYSDAEKALKQMNAKTGRG